ncbi:MAG: DUF86 domain-containing protein [Bacteroidetes bacterium]|jgi:uncharacterized protein YutE (UPF0331/DUF86 family)|nr:DUF86 domain-containing protein [Bacteroidota bacterium]
MSGNVVLNKVESIERCLARIREDYEGHEEDFLTNYMRQDAIVLNLQRACEQAIDLANHIVKAKKLGVPQNSREAFELLAEAQLVRPATTEELSNMVGFRNIAIHNYTKLDMDIVQAIITEHLDSLRDFTKAALQLL